MSQKQCLIIVAIIMGVALLLVGLYYGIREYKTTHKVVCSIEQGWDCPEDLLECYEEMKKPDNLENCPAKEWACKPIEVEVCE